MNVKNLSNNGKEYIFTKVIDNEPLNMKLIEAIDNGFNDGYLGKYRNDIGGGHVKAAQPIDLCHHQSFSEMASIVEEFSIECSHEYNKQSSSLHSMSDLYIKTHIANTKCYMMWGFKYKSGEGATAHNHWPSTWTFTYYIDPPSDASGLFFPDSNYEMEIEHGLLVLIKGDVIHEVKRKEFEGNRYCVAGLVSTNILDIQGFLTGVSNPPQKAS